MKKVAKNILLSLFLGLFSLSNVFVLIPANIALATNENNGHGQGQHKIGICHNTSSENNPWVYEEIDESAWNEHQNNHGDFLYGGPAGGNHNDKKEWCGDNEPEVVVDDPTPPTPVKPTICPFNLMEGRTIVNFGDTWLSDNPGAYNYSTSVHPVNLPAGTYKVSLASWDGYPNRVNVSQQFEQFFAVALNGSNVVGESNSTPDLADNVIEASWSGVVNENLVLNQNIDGIKVEHVLVTDPNFASSHPNSVHPICGSFDLIEEIEEPQQCNIISDTTNIIEDGITPATETWVHPNWVQSIASSLAKWIWNSEYVVNPDIEETEIFTKTFTVGGPIQSADIKIAADNGYKLEINGNLVTDKLAIEDNFSTIQGPTDVKSHLVNGTNTIKFTVKNLARPGQGITNNPAGLLYDLTVKSESCSSNSVPVEPKTSEVTMCKFDEQHTPLAGWTLMLEGDSVQSNLQVPANSSSGVNSSSLTNGVSYIAKAIGTWLNQGGVNPVDAEYSTTDLWATHMDGYTGYSTDILELQINNKFDPTSNWGTYNSAHTYAQSFIPSVAGPANFRIFDGTGTTQEEGWFGDNSGNLTININKGYAGITGENGCTTFSKVPYGTYTTKEIMQDGWENVPGAPSGLGDVVVDTATETFWVVNRTTTIPEEEEEEIINESTIVKQVDLTTTYDLSKWFFYNDETDIIDNTLGSFVTGPSTAPLGNGSAQMTVNGTQRRNLATYQFKDIKLADIKNLNFSTYSQLAGDGSLGLSERAPYLNFNVDFDNSNTWQQRLVFVPGKNGVVVSDTWQNWDAVNAGNALWSWSGYTANGNKWPDNDINQYRTWSDLITSFPNAETKSTNSWLGFRVGEPYADGFTGNVDKFVMGIKNGLTTTIKTFDFEPTPIQNITTIVPENNDEEDSDNDNDHNNQRIVSSGSYVGGSPLGQVLGAETSCGIYIDKYINKGTKNDIDAVKKLQKFLNDYMKFTLKEDGVYGSKTEKAVKEFQVKHSDKVLSPWNLNKPTGIFYKTTQTQVNNIMCPDLNLPIPPLD